MNTLEILKEARTKISGDWDFGVWNRCTCGHIYRVVTGKDGASENAVLSNMYHPVLCEVAIALGWKENSPSTSPGCYISEYTKILKRRAGDMSNIIAAEYGIRVLDEAIAKLEAEYEQARIDVLAQTKNIVNNAKVEDDSRSLVA